MSVVPFPQKPNVPTAASDGTVVTVGSDGTVTIEAPAVHIPKKREGKFGENLAEVWSEGTLATVGEDVLEGIDSDIQSRSSLIADYNKGVDLLGLKIEDAANTRTQKRNISKVGNPELLAACIKYQSTFRGEMLPANGPAKIATVAGSDEAEDQRALAFENGFNYFLTQIDKGYYPDTDRMAFYQAFGGNAYKKIMRDPIRKIPLSRMVSMIDLIVSEDANSLEDAQRVTHQIYQTKGQLRRMMLAGLYRDISLGQSSLPVHDSARETVKRAEGLAASGSRPQDVPYQTYECDVELEPSWYGFDEQAPSDLPLPYKVTIDRTSRQVLAVWRNWKPGDEFFLKRNMYVKYGFAPGLGFHDMGYLQMLGNQTKALRALWRLMLDAGMFSLFPGGLKSKGTRQQSNELAPGPGQWIDVDVPPNQSLKDSFLPMPYKDVQAVYPQLAQMISADARNLAGTVMLDVGNGLSNVPVGTLLAAIEQTTTVMGAIHKRNHTSQGQELQMIRDLMIDNPDDVKRFIQDPTQAEAVMEAFADMNLVPASDPNVPSQMHRVMLATAMMTAAQQDSKGIYDAVAVNKHAWRIMGVRDVDNFIHAPPPPGPPPPDPALIGVQVKAQTEQQKLQQAQQETERKAANEAVEAEQKREEAQMEMQAKREEMGARMRIAGMQEDTERMRLETEHVREMSAQARAAQQPAGTGGIGGAQP